MNSKALCSNGLSSRAILCNFLILPLLLLAQPVAAQDEIVLTARPGLCILKEPQTRQCVMGVELSWRGPVGDYCLYQSVVQEPLACWAGKAAGELQSRLVSEEDVTYWLQRTLSQEHLAEVVVRVVSLAQRRPQNRRRRHAWTPL
ncbi:Uncharacterised protein [Halioglobus japonicus]|nr:Uncharacterised protein [Halioglobus japonicus]